MTDIEIYKRVITDQELKRVSKELAEEKSCPDWNIFSIMGIEAELEEVKLVRLPHDRLEEWFGMRDDFLVEQIEKLGEVAHDVFGFVRPEMELVDKTITLLHRRLSEVRHLREAILGQADHNRC